MNLPYFRRRTIARAEDELRKRNVIANGSAPGAGSNEESPSRADSALHDANEDPTTASVDGAAEQEDPE